MPSGKAAGFGPATRGFESYLPRAGFLKPPTGLQISEANSNHSIESLKLAGDLLVRLVEEEEKNPDYSNKPSMAVLSKTVVLPLARFPIELLQRLKEEEVKLYEVEKEKGPKRGPYGPLSTYMTGFDAVPFRDKLFSTFKISISSSDTVEFFRQKPELFNQVIAFGKQISEINPSLVSVKIDGPSITFSGPKPQKRSVYRGAFRSSPEVPQNVHLLKTYEISFEDFFSSQDKRNELLDGIRKQNHGN